MFACATSQSLLGAASLCVALLSTLAPAAASEEETRLILKPDMYRDCRTMLEPRYITFWPWDGNIDHDLTAVDDVNNPQKSWLWQLQGGNLVVDPSTGAFNPNGSCTTFDQWTKDPEDAPDGANEPALLESSFHVDDRYAGHRQKVSIGGWVNDPPKGARFADGTPKKMTWAICYAKLKGFSDPARREYADCAPAGTIR